MGTIVKWASRITGVILLLLGMLIGYVVATFDPAQYQRYAIEAVKQATRRTLKLEGDIALSVFPRLALSVFRASLSEPNVDRTFLEVESARASVRLLPLLSGRVEIHHVELRGAVARVVRSKEGRLSFEDLLGARQARPSTQPQSPYPRDEAPRAKSSEAGAKPSRHSIELAGITLADASIDYRDEADGRRYVLSNIQAETGHIADGVPGSIQLALDLQADQPALSLQIAAETGFYFEVEKRLVRLDGLELTVKGNAPGVTGLHALARGSITIATAQSEILLSKLNLTTSGRWSNADFSASLDAPRLALSREKLSSDAMSLELLLQSAGDRIQARMKVPEVDGSRESFTIDALEMRVSVTGHGRSVDGAWTSRITGNPSAKRLEIPQITLTLSASDPVLPNGPIDARIEAAARMDWAVEEASAELAGKLDESRIEARVGVTQFAQPAYTFDCSIDQLDADRYLASSGSKKSQAPERALKPASQEAEAPPKEPLDFSVLNSLTLDGAIRIGRLKVFNLRSSQIQTKIRAANGRLEVSPLIASLYGGSLTSAFWAQSASPPAFGLRQRISGVSVGALLRDATNSDKMDGKGTFTVDLATEGSTEAEVKTRLNGTASMIILDGSVKGIDLAGVLRDAKARLRESRDNKTLGDQASEKTSFTEMKASFVIKSGVAHNRDLSIKSPLLRVSGEGSIDIGRDRMDYLLRPMWVGTSKGQRGLEASELEGVVVPVRITGPLKAPQYSIDYSALTEELGKSLLDKAAEQLKGKRGGAGKIEDRLKGLLGR